MNGTQIFRRQFTIEETIANGGFAVIYQATYAVNQMTVALKVSRIHEDPGYSRSIREEARILGRMDHRCVVKLYALPRPGKSPVNYARAVELPSNPYFFVMEYLNGGNLAEYLKKVGRLTVPEAVTIALEIARGLRYIHRKSYAHNDIKPENIVFREPIQAGKPFTPVLVDFGIATSVRVQVEAGSLYVMAPEQISQVKLQKPPEVIGGIDPTKVDVWGLGVLLYRMLGGRLPFEGRTERHLTDQILTSRPTSLTQLAKDIPNELDSLVLEGCLAKNPAQRLDMITVGHWLNRLGGNVTATTVSGSGWFGLI